MEATMTTHCSDIVSDSFASVDASGLIQGMTGEEILRHPSTELLRRAGLRLTRQRLVLCWLLFAKGGRHISAEILHDEAMASGIYISLATVYNTLHQLTEAGLLRQIGIDGSKSFFDTNPGAHHHFFVDEEERLLDIPETVVLFDTPPEPLPGYVVSRVDVIVHLRRKKP